MSFARQLCGLAPLTFCLILLSAVYYFWGWSLVLGGFGGDNAVYLLTARHFSPWSVHSDVAAHFAVHSQYPPLYPLVLAIFGGGESLLVAHLITVTFLLLAFIALFTWLRTLKTSALAASLLVLLFALMPCTYMQALEILSENLYLFLTLVCLASVAAYENDKRLHWLWIAAASIAAATLTRSAGISLVVAYAVYLTLHRPPRFWLLAAAAITPMIAWNLFGQHESPGYLASLIEKYGTDPLESFWRHLSIEIRILWIGWIDNFNAGLTARLVAGFFGALCVLGMIYRIYLRKLDGLYVAAYLAMILIWPFPAEAARLLFVVVPVLLVHGTLLLGLLPTLRTRHLEIKPVYIFLLALLLTAIPGLALTIQRFLEPMPQEFADYRRTPKWYDIDPQIARKNVMVSVSLVMHLSSLKAVVPKDDCIYGIKPSVISYYSERMSILPPDPRLNEVFFDAHLRETDCRYFYAMIFFSPSFPEPYYPLERLHESLWIVGAAPTVEGVDKPVGVLAEREQLRRRSS